MRIKLDENLSRYLKETLTRLGHDADTVADEGLLSQPDTLVGRAAQRAGRMLFSLDVGFADLRKYAPGTHPGIVVFRLSRMGPGTVNAFVERFVRETDLSRLVACLVIVEEKRIRVRRPPAAD